MTQATACHLFCTVIDNYGDLGVCWRLARHLAREHDITITLWVDDLRSFQHLAPGIDSALEAQTLGDVTIRHWPREFPAIAPADLVIEGFACALPSRYIAAMAAQPVAPVWINLEYLSAEDWVDDCHGLASTHPQTGLLKHFWFPGFTPTTGGLLRTSDELAVMRETEASRPANDRRRITLFGYEQPVLDDLLDALASDATPTALTVFAGRALPDVAQWLGRALAFNETLTRGSLSITLSPLLPHADYDRLLAASDLNLVRGEDSFVRAQWAGAAMLWHIYPQDEAAHLVKLAAWQQRVEAVVAAAGTPMPASWGRTLAAWNEPSEQTNTTSGAAPDTALDWPRFLADLPAIRRAMQSWRQHLLAQPDLATQLMRFYADRVESRPK